MRQAAFIVRAPGDTVCAGAVLRVLAIRPVYNRCRRAPEMATSSDVAAACVAQPCRASMSPVAPEP